MGHEKGTVFRTTRKNHKPKGEPLSRLWFLARGYKQADTMYTNGQIVWLHPETNDVLTKYGTKLVLSVLPYEKHKPNATQYLCLPIGYGNIYLARLKYITFVGPIPKGYTIDHIDGDTFNNNPSNLRAVPPAINRRDGGFMRKLRNNGIFVKQYPDHILDGYKRLAYFKNTHTERQYRKLQGEALKRVFLGINPIGISPDGCNPVILVSCDPLDAAAEERNIFAEY